MNEIIIYLIPLLIILFTASFTYGKIRNIAKAHNYGLLGNILAIIINTILIFYSAKLNLSIEFNLIEFNFKTLWIQEFILIMFFIYNVSTYPSLEKSHHNDMILCVQYIILACLMALFYTNNLLIISMIIVCLVFLVDYLYWFGISQKPNNTMKMSQIRKMIILVMFLILNYLIYRWLGVFNLNSIVENISSLPILPKSLLFYGFLIISLLVFVGGPFSAYEREDYYGKSNIFHSRLSQTLVFPFILIFFFKFLLLFFPPYHFFGIITFILGLFGLIFNITRILMELFGINIKKSYNLLKVMGYQNNLDYNFALILMAFYHLVPTIENHNHLLYLDLITNFLFIIIIGKTLIWEALNPVISYTKDWNMKKLGKWGKLFPSFGIIILFSLFYSIGPGFPGMNIIQTLFELNFEGVPQITILNGLKWGILILFITYITILPTIFGSILIYTFYNRTDGSNSKDLSKKSPIIIKYYIFGPIFLILIIILQIVYIATIKELQPFFF